LEVVNLKPRAIIIGGSLGGLFAANLLREVCGWEVDVYERAADDLAARGAGIGTHDEMFSVIRRLGLAVDESFGIRLKIRRVFDRTGVVAFEQPLERTMSSWVRFYRPLKDRLPEGNYHFGKSLTGIEQDAAGVTAVFSDGSRARGDLLVGCDGFRSTVRSVLMPDLELRYASYIAWRGMVDERDIPEHLHREMFEYHAFCLPEGEYITVYPVPGPDDNVSRGGRRANFVWYHPMAPEPGLRDLCTDVTGHCHGTAIAPHLIRPDVTAEVRRLASRLFAPQIAELVGMVKQPFFQAIFDLECPSVVQGRVALLGDAAFVARPHLGMGTTKAALDAQWLVDALQAEPGDLQAALARYNESVCRFGRLAVARGRWLGAHLEAQVTKPRSERTEHELHHMPLPVLLREYGAPLAEIPDLAAACAGTIPVCSGA